MYLKSKLEEKVRWFSEYMVEKLFKNYLKTNWTECPNAYLLQRLKDEVRELEEALINNEKNGVVLEAVDVANFAMMIADNTMRRKK